MLEIKSFCFGPFGTNTYVVSDAQGHILLVDPACYTPYEQQQLLDCINSLSSGAKPEIVATHGHLDHLWGAAWACEQWDTPVLLHPADFPMVEAMQDQYDMFGVRQTAKPFKIAALKDSKWATNTNMADMTVIPTPGHTPGSVCLYWEKEKVLLSGDTLFQMGYGRTDLPGGNISQLIDSLERLFELPSDVRVFPGHGAPTTIAAERRY